MREASGKTTGIVGMGGVQVDGEAKKGAIDRPARRMKKVDDDEDEDRARYASGGRLTAEKRDDLPKKDFALPGRRYPINDKSHGRAALSMVAAHGSPQEKAKVRSAVKRKYPGIRQSSDSDD